MSWEEMNGFNKTIKWIKGNKMGFAGFKDERIEHLLCYT